MEKLAIIIIMASVAFHTLLNLREKVFTKNMLYLLGWVLFVSLVMANKDNPDFSVNRILVAIPLCFVGGLGTLYKNEILPETNERTLHFVSLIYVYSILSNMSDGFNIWVIISIIPAAIIVYYATVMRSLRPFEKVMLYCLNIYFLVIISYYNLKRIVLYDLPEEMPVSMDVSFALSIFYISGILFYIIIYIMNLLWAIPLTFGGESNDDTEARLKEQTTLFIKKVGDRQASPRVTVVSTVFLGVMMLLSIRFNIVPHSFTEIVLLVILVVDSNKQYFLNMLYRMKSFGSGLK
ncbi:MAG: hypothetical protein AB2L13_00755 [Spirochaetota bacterium]